MAPAHSKRARFASGALALALAACSQPDEANRAQTPPPASPKAIPAPPPPLGRAELIRAVEAASASTAAGEAYPSAAAQLAGRRFSLKLPFGCNGPSPANAKVRYSYDAERGALQLSAAPEIWTDAPWARQLAGATAAGPVEAIEGFWLRRPWLPTDNCPAAPGPTATAGPLATEATAKAAPPREGPVQPPALAPPPVLASPETLGLAQAFEAEGSRLLRRGGRPYEITLRLGPEDAPGPQGYRLVLQGRLSSAPEPIRCRSESADRRPVCLAIVEFDRVAFENPAGKTLAEWRG